MKNRINIFFYTTYFLEQEIGKQNKERTRKRWITDDVINKTEEERKH